MEDDLNETDEEEDSKLEIKDKTSEDKFVEENHLQSNDKGN